MSQFKPSSQSADITEMANWIHRFLNPHCPECTVEHDCKTCDTLKQLLEQERYEKTQLLNTIIGKNEEPIIERKEITPEQLKPRTIPWKVRQQMLEAEDRAAAKIMKQKEREEQDLHAVERLEKELGIGDIK